MLALIHVCVNPVTTIEAVPVDGWVEQMAFARQIVQENEHPVL